MAYNFRGTGVVQYGMRKFRADGSYVTTDWVAFSYFPLAPIVSKRVMPTGEVKYYGLHPRRTLAATKEPTLNWGQVLSVYGWWIAEVMLGITAAGRHSYWFGGAALLLMAVPWLLRKRAMDRVKAIAARKARGFSAEISE